MRDATIFIILLFPIVNCDSCPKGYTQAPNGGDCFKTINFYDSFSGNYFPESFDEADTLCNDNYAGGLLASIHSEEENSLIQQENDPNLSCNAPLATKNIGLKCTGKLCTWYDGTPLTYTNFDGDGPSDKDGESCYGLMGNEGKWYKKKNCGKQNSDCWICRVKARTIDCTDDEISHNSGCVSVHKTPMDQQSAAVSCPGGGHLAAIHGNFERDFYTKVALDAGVVGSVYIGGQFSNGLFEWSDGTFKNFENWANGFPNTIFGSCVQILLDSEFGVQGQWTNIDCGTKQAYICYREAPSDFPTVAPRPKANAKCPSVQYYTVNGNIYSPNYPLSIPSGQSCEYVIGTNEGTRASINFSSYDCQTGTTLSLYDGLDSKHPFLTFADTQTPNATYSTSSNVMKIVFTADETSVGTGWEANFVGI
ncbi:hypothetical protein PRIPAC_83445 [Pristionchus pacificus]|uniref:CUB domain-containing protein n=1 Tax=Pristionchus pacificus TaxID=54126 RepID=A0A2A6BSS1_PRIPA|nr:hypothetical protein PRIPAC_83445 [Pristionchus pacificus]|eukprot:PDM68866.1 CUB domain-containing protein [Pristionchus pacificus]